MTDRTSDGVAEPGVPADERRWLQLPASDVLDAAWDALRGVYDPELYLDVVSLGLVYDVRAEAGTVVVEMTMTTPGCPMHESIVGAAERALRTYFPTRIVDVQLVWEPPWTTARLSPEARAQLGRY